MRWPCLCSVLRPERPDAPGELSDTIRKLQERRAGLAAARSMPRSLALLAAVLGFTPSVLAQVKAECLITARAFPFVQRGRMQDTLLLWIHRSRGIAALAPGHVCPEARAVCLICCRTVASGAAAARS